MTGLKIEKLIRGVADNSEILKFNENIVKLSAPKKNKCVTGGPFNAIKKRFCINLL